MTADMRKAGHPQRRAARPTRPVRQIGERSTIVARRVGLSLILIGGTFGLGYGLATARFDGVGLISTLVVIAGYAIILIGDENERPW